MIAACFIGGASASGGVGKVLGAVIGAMVMGVMNNGMSILGIGIDYQQVIKGLVLLAAVFVDVYNRNKALNAPCMPPTHGHRDYRQPPERKSMHARIVRTWACASSPASSRPASGCPPRRCCWPNTTSAARCCAKRCACWSPRGWCCRSSAPARWCGRATSGTCSTPTCCIG